MTEIFLKKGLCHSFVFIETKIHAKIQKNVMSQSWENGTLTEGQWKDR